MTEQTLVVLTVPGPVIAEVVAGLTVLAIGTVIGRVWARRSAPAAVVDDLRDSLERRRRQQADQDHAQLVRNVLQRAEVLDLQAPVAVTRRAEVVTVTWHPSGQRLHYVDDLPRYRQLLQSGRLPARQTFWERWRQPPVSRWSTAELRSWLADHAHQLPAVQS